MLYASLIICVLGVGPRRPGGAAARAARHRRALVVTAITAALPSFVAAMMLISVFAVQLGWFPALGNGDRASSTTSGT